MEINVEKKVGFQKLPQDENDFLKHQKKEKSRLKIFIMGIVIILCLSMIGIVATIFYMDGKEISIENKNEPMNNSISGEKNIYKEQSKKEQIVEHLATLEILNKTVCSNSSHSLHDPELCEKIQESIFDYQNSEIILE